MKKFKIAFTVAFIVFAAFYLFAIVKDAKNPFENIFSNKKIEENEEEKIDDLPKKDENFEEGNKVAQLTDDEYFFLLFGTDSHDVNIDTGYRSDTMILTKVNFKTGAITMMNFPRDSRVAIPGKGLKKLNAAKAFGGTTLMIKTFRDAFNIDLDYFVEVDYTLVENLIDAIGGVPFNVPRDMNYYDPTDKPPLRINIKAGQQVLNGHDAVGVWRWRKNSDGSGYMGGDIERIGVQQELMKAVMNQVLKIENIARLPKIFSELKSNIKTNFSEKQVLQAIISASKLDLNNISMNTLPGEGKYIGTESFYVIYENQANEMIDNLFGEYRINGR
ncbi:MAG: LCP family protein [Firmicutes bacterium]|nr:LCP family protein [Bacillota bacterium]